MKKSVLLSLLAVLAITAFCQQRNTAPAEYNALLWRVTGKNLFKPSYLFGTMHMICADDIVLSDSLSKAIEQADDVYLELDMDNMMEMMGALSKMKMRNDTTLADLLSAADYKSVKEYFTANTKLIPFAMLETFKPLMAASIIMEQQASLCKNFTSMEQLIMTKAQKSGVDIKGLETMAFQLAIFDSIPYRQQAKQLLQMVKNGSNNDTTEMVAITNAYRRQELGALENLIKKDDMGIANFTELLLYHRNSNWAKKLQMLMGEKSLVVAVGAGHLPGERGVINLLRKAGYQVVPVKSTIIKKLPARSL